MGHSNTSHRGELWDMKDAAKHVGRGLPALYERMREKGLVTRVSTGSGSPRNMPVRRLQEEGYFIVYNSSFWDRQNGLYRPCPKVKATYKGLILLQEIADELAREKQKSPGKRSGVPGSSDGDRGEGAVGSDHTGARTAGSTRQ